MILKEFKHFILKGNVVELATGVIIGAAFTSIVTAFSKGIVEPILALAGGGMNPKWSIVLKRQMVEVTEKVNGQNVTKSVEKLIELDLGMVLGAIISFLITAAIVFFVIVKPMNRLLKFLKPEEAAAAGLPSPAKIISEVELLAEIRDLLKGGSLPVLPRQKD